MGTDKPEEERKKGGIAAWWLSAKECLPFLGILSGPLGPIALGAAIGLTAVLVPQVRQRLLSELSKTSIGASILRPAASTVLTKPSPASTGSRPNQSVQNRPAQAHAPDARAAVSAPNGGAAGNAQTGVSDGAAQGAMRTAAAGSDSGGATQGAERAAGLTASQPGNSSASNSRAALSAQASASSGQARSGRAPVWQSSLNPTLQPHFGASLGQKLGSSGVGLGRGLGANRSAAAGRGLIGSTRLSGGAGRSGAAGGSGEHRSEASDPNFDGGGISGGGAHTGGLNGAAITAMAGGAGAGGGGGAEGPQSASGANGQLLATDSSLAPASQGDLTNAANTGNLLYDGGGNKGTLPGDPGGGTAPVLTYTDPAGPVGGTTDPGALPGTDAPPTATAGNATPWQSNIDLAKTLQNVASKLISVGSLLVWAGKQLLHTVWGMAAGAAMIATGMGMAWGAAAAAGVATLLGLSVLIGSGQKFQGAIMTVSAAALMVAAIHAAEGDKSALNAAEDHINGIEFSESANLTAALAPNNLAAIQTGLGLALGNSPAGQLIGGGFGLYNGISGLAAGGGLISGLQAGVGLAQTVVGIVKPGGEMGQILSTALTGVGAGLSMANSGPSYQRQTDSDGNLINPPTVTPAPPTTPTTPTTPAVPAGNVASMDPPTPPVLSMPTAMPLDSSLLGLGVVLPPPPPPPTVMPPGFVGPLAPGQVYSPSDQTTTDTTANNTPVPLGPPPAAGALSPSMSNNNMASRYIGDATVQTPVLDASGNIMTDDDGNPITTTKVLALVPGGKQNGFDVLNPDGSPAGHISYSAGLSQIQDPNNQVTTSDLSAQHAALMNSAAANAPSYCQTTQCAVSVDPNTGSIGYAMKLNLDPNASPNITAAASDPTLRIGTDPSGNSYVYRAQDPPQPPTGSQIVGQAFDTAQKPFTAASNFLSNQNQQLQTFLNQDYQDGNYLGMASDITGQVFTTVAKGLTDFGGSAMYAGNYYATNPNAVQNVVTYAAQNPWEVATAAVPGAAVLDGGYKVVTNLGSAGDPNSPLYQGMGEFGNGLFAVAGMVPEKSALNNFEGFSLDPVPGPPATVPVVPGEVKLPNGLVLDEGDAINAAYAENGASKLPSGGGSVEVGNTAPTAQFEVGNTNPVASVDVGNTNPGGNVETGSTNPGAQTGATPPRQYVSQITKPDGTVVNVQPIDLPGGGQAQILAGADGNPLTATIQSSEGPRPVVLVEMPDGSVQPFYQSTGKNSGMGGTYLPFDGQYATAGLSASGGPVPASWLDKGAFVGSDVDPSLQRFGTPENQTISQSLGNTGLDASQGPVFSNPADLNAWLEANGAELSPHVVGTQQTAAAGGDFYMPKPGDSVPTPPAAGTLSPAPGSALDYSDPTIAESNYEKRIDASAGVSADQGFQAARNLANQADDFVGSVPYRPDGTIPYQQGPSCFLNAACLNNPNFPLNASPAEIYAQAGGGGEVTVAGTDKFLSDQGYQMDRTDVPPLKTLATPDAESQLVDLLRGGDTPVAIILDAPPHAVLIQGAGLVDGEWKFVVVDSNFNSPQIYSMQELQQASATLYTVKPTAPPIVGEAVPVIPGTSIDPSVPPDVAAKLPAATPSSDPGFETYLKQQTTFGSGSLLDQGVPPDQIKGMLQNYLDENGINAGSTQGQSLLSKYGFGATSPVPATPPVNPAVDLANQYFQQRALVGGSGPPNDLASLNTFLDANGVPSDSPLAGQIKQQITDNNRVINQGQNLLNSNVNAYGSDDVTPELISGVQSGQVVNGTFYRGMSTEEYAQWVQSGGLPNGTVYKFVGMDQATIDGQYAGQPGTVLVGINGLAVPYAPGAAEGEALIFATKGPPTLIKKY